MGDEYLVPADVAVAVGGELTVVSAGGIVAADVLAVGERKAEVKHVAVLQIPLGHALGSVYRSVDGVHPAGAAREVKFAETVARALHVSGAVVHDADAVALYRRPQPFRDRANVDRAGIQTADVKADLFRAVIIDVIAIFRQHLENERGDRHVLLHGYVVYHVQHAHADGRGVDDDGGFADLVAGVDGVVSERVFFVSCRAAVLVPGGDGDRIGGHIAAVRAFEPQIEDVAVVCVGDLIAVAVTDDHSHILARREAIAGVRVPHIRFKAEIVVACHKRPAALVRRGHGDRRGIMAGLVGIFVRLLDVLDSVALGIERFSVLAERDGYVVLAEMERRFVVLPAVHIEDAAVARVLLMAEADFEREARAALGARMEREHPVRQIGGRCGHARILAEIRDDVHSFGRIVPAVVAGVAAGIVARAVAAVIAAGIVAGGILPIAGIGGAARRSGRRAGAVGSIRIVGRGGRIRRFFRIVGRRRRIRRSVRLIRRRGRAGLAGKVIRRHLGIGVGAETGGAAGRQRLGPEQRRILFARIGRLDALRAAHGEHAAEQQRRRQRKAERTGDRLIVHIHVSFLRLPARRFSSAGER